MATELNVGRAEEDAGRLLTRSQAHVEVSKEAILGCDRGGGEHFEQCAPCRKRQALATKAKRCVIATSGVEIMAEHHDAAGRHWWQRCVGVRSI
jgi:hypothetical protein